MTDTSMSARPGISCGARRTAVAAVAETAQVMLYLAAAHRRRRTGGRLYECLTEGRGRRYLLGRLHVDQRVP